MTPMELSFESFGMALLAIGTAALTLVGRDSWSERAEAEFQTALKDLQISQHVLIIDRMMPPYGNSTAEVYRILHDQQERYFLYMQIGDSSGVLKPLTKERALLAATLSGYARMDSTSNVTPMLEARSLTSNDAGRESVWNEAQTPLDLQQASGSGFHTCLVKLTLYLILWPNILLTFIFTLAAVAAPPVMILMIFAWWGLGALIVLYNEFAGKWDEPGKGTWCGLILANLIVLGFGWGGGISNIMTPSVYWLVASCMPVSMHWAWLSHKGFRFKSNLGNSAGQS